MCCSIADSLGDALDTVLKLDPPPDQIVIEASGVADPAKVAHYGQGWPGCRLDAVVVLADSSAIQGLAVDQFVGELVVRQLCRGDLVVLTKTDLVSEAALGEVQQWIGEVTGSSPPVLAANHLPAEEQFESVVIQPPAAIRRQRLETALTAWPAEILRVKGFATIAHEGRHLVQRVGRRWSIEPLPGNDAGDDQLVFIGLRGALSRSQLQAVLW